MKRFICKWWGHSWDPEGAEFYCVYYCTRCEHQGHGDEWDLRGRVKLWIYWRVDAIKRRWYSFLYWLKCSECGERFGKHNDAFDHIPF